MSLLSWMESRWGATSVGGLLRRLRAAGANGDHSGIFWARVVGTLGSKITIVILGLASAVLTARVLGPDGRGVFAVLLTIGALGVQFGNLGLPSAVTYRVASDRDELKDLIGTSLVAGLGVGSLLAAGFFLLIVLVPAMAPLDSVPLLAWGLAWIPFGILNVLVQNLLLGLHRIRLYNLIQMFNKGGAVGLLFLLFLFGQAGVLPFYLASFSVLIIGCAIALVAVLREAELGVRLPSREIVWGATRYGFKAYLATLFAYVVLHFDILMVSGMLGDEAAGHYSIAARMGEMIYLVPVAVGSILFATVSSMKTGQWRFAKRTVKVVALVLVVGLGAAAAVADPVVRLLFGEAFMPAVSPFLWLLPGLLALGVNTIIMNYFAGVGMPWIAVVSPGLAAVANVLLNVLLLPRHGIDGAAMASTAAYGMMLVTSLIYLRRVPQQSPV